MILLVTSYVSKPQHYSPWSICHSSLTHYMPWQIVMEVQAHTALTDICEMWSEHLSYPGPRMTDHGEKTIRQMGAIVLDKQNKQLDFGDKCWAGLADRRWSIQLTRGSLVPMVKVLMKRKLGCWISTKEDWSPCFACKLVDVTITRSLFDKILNLFYFSTYVATLCVLSFVIISNIHWPHGPVFTLWKMSHATLWQAPEEIGTTFWQFNTLCHDHLADTATMATAKTVTLNHNCHTFTIIHLLNSKHSLDALGILYLCHVM